MARPSPVSEPSPAAGSAPVGPSATGAGTWTVAGPHIPSDDVDNDVERKRPKDGCPTPWKHCRTRHVSWSWNRLSNLGGTARPLAIWTTDVWESPVECRPRVFAYGPHSSTLQRSDPWGLGRATVETTDFGSEDPETRGFCLGSFGFGQPVAAGTLGGELKRIVRSVVFYEVVHGITFAGFLRRLGDLAPQATNPCKRDRDCLEYKAVALHSSGIVDSEDGCCFSFGNVNTRETWAEIQLKIAEDDRSRDHSAILSTQVRLTRRKQMASHATHLPKTSTWDAADKLHRKPQLSSIFVFDKRLGRPLVQCVNWTHVHSRARRKSKWTIGVCGALRRCGCAWTMKGTQFHCVKFRLGSAGEPTICSHCYDVLNEDKIL